MEDRVIGDISVVVGVQNEYLDKISKIVNAPSYVFDVMNRDEDIFLIHYKKEYPAYSRLRGTIVDIEKEAIIVDGSYDVIEVIADSLSDVNGTLTLVDTNSKCHTVSKYIITSGYEGTTIRVFKAKGKVYRATYKTLYSYDKKWGVDKCFGDMWKELKCPSDDDLFGDEESSGHCYHFLLSHKYLQVGSRFLTMNPGFTVLLQATKTCYPATKSKFEVSDEIPKAKLGDPFVCGNSVLTPEGANDYLKYGLHPDEPLNSDMRLRCGEFVMIHCPDEGISYKVMSTAYNYRLMLRNNKALIKDRYLEHIDEAIKDEKMLTEEGFLRRYIPLKYFDTPVVVPAVFNGIKWPLTRDMAIKLISRCFIASIPPSLQSEHKDLLKEFFNVRNEVTKWMIDLSSSKIPRDGLSAYHKRVNIIISQARKYAINGGAQRWDMQEKIKTNIKYMVGKEFVFSLYRLHKIMLENTPQDEKPKQNVVKFVYSEGSAHK